MRSMSKQRKLKMAKEHFKFDFEEWMAEELIHRDDWKEWYEAMCEIPIVGGKLTQSKE